MSAKELWTWIHYNYGDDLGLTSEDEDYVPPQSFEELSEKLKEEIPIIKVGCELLLSVDSVSWPAGIDYLVLLCRLLQRVDGTKQWVSNRF